MGKFQLFYYLFNHKESPLEGKVLVEIAFDAHQTPKTPSLLFDMIRQKEESTELQNLKALHNILFFDTKIPRALEDRYVWLNNALDFSYKKEIVSLNTSNVFAFLTLQKDYAKQRFLGDTIFADEVRYFYRLPYLEVCIVTQQLERLEGREEIFCEEMKREYRYLVILKEKAYSPRLFLFLCKSEVILESIEMRLGHFTSLFGEEWTLIA